MTIAFIGLGKMGSGMASRLIAAKHPLVVWNRTPAKAEALIGEGARVAATAEAAVAEADVVISSLMDDKSVEALFGASGKALAALRHGAIHLCVTTISPGAADRLAAAHKQRGAFYVSGPVVGVPTRREPAS